MDKDYFYFKKFKLRNKLSALKVNTDGVLLGAWVDTSNDKNVLDVGTGSGIIALMLRQRAPQNIITAIDINEESYKEASFNILLNEASNISVKHISFQCFASESKTFDHIVSNPPYFQNSTPSKDAALTVAKHNTALSFDDFWKSAQKLTNDKSKVSVILPIEEANLFCKMSKDFGFDKNRSLWVYPKVNTQPKRILIEFRSPLYCNYQSEKIYLHEDDKRNYSQAYQALTKDFYLKF